MDTHDLAWAAGFFDGEGWAAAKERGVQARINQAGVDGIPEVLLRFRRIVGVGRIKGPVLAEGKQPLYYWEATSRPDLLRVVDLIGPWMCPAKRAEFASALRISLRAVSWPGSMSEELAWAGGFFDGEGSTYLSRHRSHPGRRVPVVHVTQSSDSGVAPELLRLRAVTSVGTISGVQGAKSGHKPYRRWRVFARNDVELAVHLLFPFIGTVKRAQVIGVMRYVRAQPDLPRGNATFGVAGARYCLRGHDKWNARVRPYVSRGQNRGGNDRHQCLTCVRDDARSKRHARKREE